MGLLDWTDNLLADTPIGDALGGVVMRNWRELADYWGISKGLRPVRLKTRCTVQGEVCCFVKSPIRKGKLF